MRTLGPTDIPLFAPSLMPVPEFIREIASDADPCLSTAPISDIAPLAAVPGPSLDSPAAPAFPLLTAGTFCQVLPLPRVNPHSAKTGEHDLLESTRGALTLGWDYSLWTGVTRVPIQRSRHHLFYLQAHTTALPLPG